MWMNSSSSSPTEVCPKPPCLKQVENIQQLLVSLQQKTVEENAHIMQGAHEVPITDTAGV